MTEPTIHFMVPGVTLWHGDCIETMRLLPDASVDAVVTDPPYGIAFMGKQWDQPGEFGSAVRGGSGKNARRGEKDAALEAGTYELSSAAMRNFQKWCAEWAGECLRVLKPGGHILAFGGSRTWHRLAAGIEDAGFEIRDSIAWLYGSGMPKSLDVSKAIDKAAGAVRTEVVGVKPGHEEFVDRTDAHSGGGSAEGWNRPWKGDAEAVARSHMMLAPATEDAAKWQGWGTALKPSFEPIVVGRKPLVGTVAANVLAHGTGALNIDASRIGESGGAGAFLGAVGDTSSVGVLGNGLNGTKVRAESDSGRWPTNVLFDASQAAALDAQSGTLTSGKLEAHHARSPKQAGILGAYGSAEGARGYGDSGGASRFFPTFRYEAKAGGAERPSVDGVQHPTVKPLALMEWLIRLVTPPGGTVLEPFAGSGTTLEAAVREGFTVIGIEREADYLPLIVHRLTERDHQQSLFGDWEGGAA